VPRGQDQGQRAREAGQAHRPTFCSRPDPSPPAQLNLLAEAAPAELNFPAEVAHAEHQVAPAELKILAEAVPAELNFPAAAPPPGIRFLLG
jgi:hypothetical protein